MRKVKDFTKRQCSRKERRMVFSSLVSRNVPHYYNFGCIEFEDIENGTLYFFTYNFYRKHINNYENVWK